jgi:DNA-binding MarR family transcriptional regulator
VPKLLPLPPTPAPPAALNDRQIELVLMLAATRGPLTRRMIAERCDPESSRARTLQPMIERGLLQQKECEGDDRRTMRLLSLTPSGRELADAIRRTRERLSPQSRQTPERRR